MPLPPATPAPIAPTRRFWLSALAGLAVMIVILAFFCPRFYRFYLVPPLGLGGAAEDIRAQMVLRQLHDPIVAVPGFANRVLQWRLLFPLLGHFLRLPDAVFLGLPFAGAWLVLGWVFRRTWDGGANGASALGITLLAGTCSWFFVSTGLLGYYDSWLALALLLYTFSPSLRLRLLVCLLMPWVDERFLFEMPLLAVVRHFYLGRSAPVWRETLREFLFEILAFSPYLLLRGGGMLLGLDPESREHVTDHLRVTRHPREIAQGLWEGLRAGWILILAAAWIRRRDSRTLLLLAALAFAALVANNFLAVDVSRSTSVFVPLVVAAGLVVRQVPRGTWLIGSLAVANLLLPASHVVDGMLNQRIRPVWHEASPANLLTFQARLALNAHRPDQASVLFKQALAHNPGYISAHRGLAAVYLEQHLFPLARQELLVVTASPEGLGDDWIHLGICECALGQLEAGRASLTKGIADRVGTDETLRQSAAALLQRINPNPP